MRKNKMSWPLNPENSKNFYLSLVGGISVSIIIITNEITEILVDNNLINKFILLGVLFVLLLLCLFRISHIRNKLYWIKNRKKK